MPKHLIIVCRDSVESLPPVLNTIFILADLKYDLTVISTSVDEELERLLENRYRVQFYLSGKIIHGKSLLNTLNNNYRFRLHAKKVMSRLCLNDYILWIMGEGTALSLYKTRFCRNIKFMFSSYELYQSNVHKTTCKYFMKKAVLNIVPERNRALIYRHWFQLTQTPFVLPNKTTYLFAELEKIKDMHVGINDVIQLANDVKAKAQGRKILLYQGIISAFRELVNIVEAAKELSSEYLFVIMGHRNDYLNKLNEIWPDICYVQYIPAPFHLHITKVAYIGVVTYGFGNLNNVYCAPNKIYEYSMFGLPMLCSDVGGLTATIGAAQAGICVNVLNKKDIISGLRQIESNYDFYSKNSSSFYEHVNMKMLHEELISEYERLKIDKNDGE